MVKILVIEAGDGIRPLIERQLPAASVESVNSVVFALDTLQETSRDVIVWDSLSTQPQAGRVMATLKDLSRTCRDSCMIIISELDEPQGASGRKPRWRWLKPPVDQAELLMHVERIAGRREAEHRRRSESKDLTVPVEFEGILAFTLTMRTVIQHIIEAAATDIPVLISGETGTGKDLVAAAIHRRSARKNGRFVPVNMGAIASELIASELFGHEKGAYTGALESRPGLFEQAHGGTIFLDEITTMDEKTQISLLRVLESKTVRRVRGEKHIDVDVRVIAATNENIEEAVRSGRFREDLYYRLDVFRIELPPLRQRHGAISLLTDHFVALYAELYSKEIRTVSREAYQLIRQYPWPGNIRELKNVLQRAVLLAKGTELTADLLPQRIRESDRSISSGATQPSTIHLGMRLEEVEKEYLKMTLASVSGNKMKAASALGISRRALYNKLKRFGML